MSNILKVDGLQVSFSTPAGDLRAVDDVSFGLREEETLAVIGETGCGKSTLARSILRLTGENARIKGKIYYGGQDLLELKEKELAKIRGNAISIVLQNPDLALNPVINVGRQLLEMIRIHRHLKREQAKEEVIETLGKMGFSGIPSLLKNYPFQLSGGMKQRVLLAAAMLNNPGIIIADEPTRALDLPLRNSIIQELTAIKKMKRTAILLITHDLRLASAFSDRIAVMYAGELVEICETEKFFDKPLHPYSQVLLDSLPERGFQTVPGWAPSFVKRVKGCRFFPRCKFKKDICSEEKPRLLSIAGGQVRCARYA